MNRTTKIFLYGVYTFVALLFSLYYRFPSNAVKDRIVSVLAQHQPAMQLTTRTISPLFPPGLRFEPFYLQYKDHVILSAPSFKMTPALLSLFRNQKTVSFYSPLGNGELTGQAFIDSNAKRPQTTLAANLKNISIEALDFVNQWPAFHPSGELTAYIDYDSRKGAGGSANITMEMTPAKIVFDPPLMGMESLEFSQVKADMILTPRMLQIRRCEAGGTQMEARLNGSIIFREPVGNSRITMSCTLKPQPAFVADHKNDMIGGLLNSETAQKRGILLRLSGTLDKPSYTIR